jgi:beta-galactosidase
MLYYGACYYPEHWTAEQAKDHISLMRKAGFNVVRMGEFAWCKFEPEPGRYKFDWLDPVIEAAHRAGISTVLGTPTCVPPQWAVTRHPTMLQVDEYGRRRNPGARCHCCKNALEYQMLSDQIVEKLARHYAAVEGVIGWQTDNELGCHDTVRCYCDHCEKAFRQWLLEKYKTTDAINEAWGTAFWGFELREWNQIPLPRHMVTGPNPGHWLDFVRFCSDTQVKFQKRQYELIKSICPDHFVTHNYMGWFGQIDYYELARYVDFPSLDNYPDGADDPLMPAFAHELARSYKGRFWVMEQKSGPTGDGQTELMGEQPETGDIRRWAWQAVANGADAVCYFRWRACLTGAEQYWHGILDHDGLPRRRYAEVKKTGEEFLKVGALIAGSLVEAKVALLRDFEVLWSLERRPGAPGFSYDRHCFELYRAIKRRGHDCDILNARGDFAKYKVLLAPALTIVGEELAKKLSDFVKGGGTLVLTPQSGTRTPTNSMSDKPRPGLLAELTGVTVEEVRPYHGGRTGDIAFVRGLLIAQSCSVGTWVEVLRCASARPVAEHRDTSLAGLPAITVNDYGEGCVYYMGVYLPWPFLEKFLADLLPEFAVKEIPEGVEITQRKSDQARYVFIINHGREARSVTLPGQAQDVLSGETVGPKVKISANGVLILKT